MVTLIVPVGLNKVLGSGEHAQQIMIVYSISKAGEGSQSPEPRMLWRKAIFLWDRREGVLAKALSWEALGSRLVEQVGG